LHRIQRPNYAELGTYGRHEGTYRFEIGNEDLKIEQNLESDLGVKWETKSVAIELSGYYNFIDNYIFIGQRGDSIDHLPVYNYRQRDAQIKGLEASVDIHPAKFNGLIQNIIRNDQRRIDQRRQSSVDSCEEGGDRTETSRSKLNYILNPYISFVVSNYFEQTDVADYELPTDSYHCSTYISVEHSIWVNNCLMQPCPPPIF